MPSHRLLAPAGSFPILQSTDGITWRGRGPEPIRGIVHGNVKVYEFPRKDSEAAVLTSNDGLTWTRVKRVAESRPQPIPDALPERIETKTQVTPGLTNGAVIVYLNGRGYQLRLPLESGPIWYVQASTDLVHWVALNTNVAPSNIMFLVDSNAANFPARFYRAIELP